jgi:hypothetical protein
LPLEGSGEHAVQVLKEEVASPQQREVDIIKGLSDKTLTKGVRTGQEKKVQPHRDLESERTSAELNVEVVRESVIPSAREQVLSSPAGMETMEGVSPVSRATGLPSWEVANSKPKSELQLRVEEGLVPGITIPGVAQGHTILERMKELGVRGVSVAVINRLLA